MGFLGVGLLAVFCDRVCLHLLFFSFFSHFLHFILNHCSVLFVCLFSVSLLKPAGGQSGEQTGGYIANGQGQLTTIHPAIASMSYLTFFLHP